MYEISRQYIREIQHFIRLLNNKYSLKTLYLHYSTLFKAKYHTQFRKYLQKFNLILTFQYENRNRKRNILFLILLKILMDG